MQNPTDKLYEALSDSIERYASTGLKELNLLWSTFPHKDGDMLRPFYIDENSAELFIYDSEQYDIESIVLRLKADGYKLRYYDHKVLGRIPANISWRNNMDYENLRPAEKAREIMKRAKEASTDKVYAALVEEAMNAAARGLQELSLYWETCEPAESEPFVRAGDACDGSLNVIIYRAQQYDMFDISASLQADGFVLTHYNHSVLGEMIDTVSWEEQE